ncbi:MULTISPECIES: adenylosuccinate synthase [unclassified Halomonas]|uniref:adenylosuccinate synthase n=1 Tax=unclassified Halomonas TaxID=2609666 RepID=UPI0020767CAA|nr:MULTISPECIES: adenylosuccinate synthase [unclassified Halomonas]
MSDLVGWSHADLCEIAVKWLKRPNSNNGHGCHVAVSEVRSGWTGEIPDAIGFRQTGHSASDGSIVVEVKVSRGDFLADKKKPHRLEGGLGNWRYFMCPEGLIQPSELPAGWGLLWVNKRGHVKPQAGFAGALSSSKSYYLHQEALAASRFETDYLGEQFILVKLLARVGDAEQLNQKMREAWNEQSRLAQRCNQMAEQILELRGNLRMAKRGERSAIAELTAGLNEVGSNTGGRKSPIRPVARQDQ